ncbi:MAG: hypothetical protein J0M17_10790 [Planctomycetes bacterium]|nr:hypothetical protein [Planctomycetota bacterium]
MSETIVGVLLIGILAAYLLFKRQSRRRFAQEAEVRKEELNRLRLQPITEAQAQCLVTERESLNWEIQKRRMMYRRGVIAYMVIGASARYGYDIPVREMWSQRELIKLAVLAAVLYFFCDAIASLAKSHSLQEWRNSERSKSADEIATRLQEIDTQLLAPRNAQR